MGDGQVPWGHNQRQLFLTGKPIRTSLSVSRVPSKFKVNNDSPFLYTGKSREQESHEVNNQETVQGESWCLDQYAVF